MRRMAKLKGSYTPRRKCPWGARRSGFSGRLYLLYVEFLKNRYNAVDETFDDAINYNVATASLVVFFTLYIVLSARIRRSFIVPASAGYMAIPKLAVTLTGLDSDCR